MENVSLIKDTINNTFCMGDLGVENKEQNENPKNKYLLGISAYIVTQIECFPGLPKGVPYSSGRPFWQHLNSNKRAQLRTLKFF